MTIDDCDPEIGKIADALFQKISIFFAAFVCCAMYAVPAQMTGFVPFAIRRDERPRFEIRTMMRIIFLGFVLIDEVWRSVECEEIILRFIIAQGLAFDDDLPIPNRAIVRFLIR